MLFTKENIKKIESLISELNENYDPNEYYSNIYTYLVLDKENMRVIEVCKRFNNVSGFGASDITDEDNFEVLHTKDMTNCFREMLMFIPDND